MTSQWKLRPVGILTADFLPPPVNNPDSSTMQKNVEFVTLIDEDLTFLKYLSLLLQSVPGSAQHRRQC